MRDEQIGRSAVLEAVMCGINVCLANVGGREAKADRILA
jgi:hypothetical protein